MLLAPDADKHGEQAIAVSDECNLCLTCHGLPISAVQLDWPAADALLLPGSDVGNAQHLPCQLAGRFYPQGHYCHRFHLHFQG